MSLKGRDLTCLMSGAWPTGFCIFAQVISKSCMAHRHCKAWRVLSSRGLEAKSFVAHISQGLAEFFCLYSLQFPVYIVIEPWYVTPTTLEN